MNPSTFSSRNLQQFIEAQQIEAQILPMTSHTPTVSDAALALDVTTDQIIKSLVFVIRAEPLLVINNGLARVDRRKIAQHLGVGRKWVKFANADQALAITGYVVGSMPPFGHRQTLRTIVDPAIMQLDTIYGGGGDIDAMMRLTPEELVRITNAEIIAISE
jgi:Cys-tRNA(Pro) deacylase